MKTKAVRIYGVHDLRLEEFELPEMAEDEIQARIITDSLCLSTWKVQNQGAKQRVGNVVGILQRHKEKGRQAKDGGHGKVGCIAGKLGSLEIRC